MTLWRTVLAAFLFGAASRTHAQQALPMQPAPLAEARRAIETGRFDSADTLLREYLQTDPTSSQAAYMLAYALLRGGHAEQALTAYTQAAKLRTPSAEDLRNAAQAYVLLGDYVDADKWLTASLRMKPNDADTWYNAGRLRYTQNRFTEAVACFEKALALAPHSVKAENNLGLAYEGLNRPHDAELAYREALAWQAGLAASEASEQPLLNLATLLLHNGNLAEARELLQRAAVLAPNNASVHEQLGQLDLRELKFNDASRELKLATGLDPNRSNLHFLLGQAYKHAGEQALAAAEFAAAAHLSGSHQD